MKIVETDAARIDGHLSSLNYQMRGGRVRAAESGK